MNTIRFGRKPFLLILLIGAFAAISLISATQAAPTPTVQASTPSTLTTSAQADAQTPLCRFGVNVTGDVLDVDTSQLRMGWYVDYRAQANPPHPNGAAYVPTIRLTQVGANDYTYRPSGVTLRNVIAGNPGAAYLIGNEPDRIDFQDDVEPHIYAAAYHELYHLIKAEDPTAIILAGTIVQPTPIRLQYLDMILDSYQDTHGVPMPVDGWSIHNFILNEVSCDYDPGNCWGAEIPPGIDADFGEILTIEDNDNIDLFIERIERFRQWMADNGYRNKPLYLSEYGVLMPDWLGFDEARVNTFMTATFDYMLNATSSTTGYPADGNRLVQYWSWYSTLDTSFNGNLFNPNNNAITLMGQNYADYVAPLSEPVDVLPTQFDLSPGTPLATSGPVDITVSAIIANAGSSTTPTGQLDVRFYLGDPADGGTQLGSTQTVNLSGGQNTTVSAEWNGVSSGVYDLYVTVEHAPGECSIINNTAQRSVLVGEYGVYLPVGLR